MDGLHQKPRFDDDIFSVQHDRGSLEFIPWPPGPPKKILWMVNGNILFQGN